jgi:putative aldouronate transport system permease protein
MGFSRGEKIFGVINVMLLTLLAFASLYPFIYTVSISLSTAAEANRDGFHIWPGEVTLSAYKMVFSNPNLLTGYMNTLFRTIVGTILSIIFTCLCAYPLSKKSLPHRGMFTFIIMFTMLFGGGIIPAYLLIKNIDLINNIWVYVIPGLTGAFNVIIVKNFFESIPESLSESASIDGAGDFYILFNIYMPLSKPVLATVTLWTAVGHWNAWFDALIYVNDENKQVLMTFLRRIVIEGSTQMMEKGVVNPDMTTFTPETIKAATVIVTILPILILYPFLQKYFVKGIMLGGVKG